MSSHVSPRYNLNGNLIMQKSTEGRVEVKDPWNGLPLVNTREDLIRKRKQEKIPDLTFDIDGDGHVGNLDYFVSKKFDKDGDGKLNKEERENAEKAVKQGFLEQFRIGLERTGPSTKLRIMQKRGAIIENDDLSNVKKTYPLVRHTSFPAITTRTQLLTSRKDAKNSSESSENIFRKDVQRPKPEGFVEKPEFASISEINNAYSLTLREKKGLEKKSDIKPMHCLSTEYLQVPKYQTQKMMKEEKKRVMLEDLEKKANYNYISRDKHLLEREKYLISHNLQGKEGLTMGSIREDQRQSTNDYNMRMFSNLSIGVHGKELPKFYENSQEYWKMKETYKENPKNTSNSLFNLAKTGIIDKFSESNVTGLEIPMAERTINKKKFQEITDKPNHIMPFGGHIPIEITEFEYKPSNVKQRMSTFFGYFSKKSKEESSNFIQSENLFLGERTKTFNNLENSVAPVLEIPKSSSSTLKKHFLKSVSNNSLRTTGFLSKSQQKPEENPPI